jgi:hypothetical protein
VIVIFFKVITLFSFLSIDYSFYHFPFSNSSTSRSSWHISAHLEMWDLLKTSDAFSRSIIQISSVSPFQHFKIFKSFLLFFTSMYIPALFQTQNDLGVLNKQLNYCWQRYSNCKIENWELAKHRKAYLTTRTNVTRTWTKISKKSRLLSMVSCVITYLVLWCLQECIYIGLLFIIFNCFLKWSCLQPSQGDIKTIFNGTSKWTGKRL